MSVFEDTVGLTIVLFFCTVKACPYNYCDIPFNNFCEGKSCRMKPDCSRYECYCDETSTHLDCMIVGTNVVAVGNTTTPSLTTTIASNTTIEQNGCPNDFPCIHGFCNRTGADNKVLVCSCEPGYYGTDCSEIFCPADPCLLNVCPGQNCETLQNCSYVCYCDDNTTACVNNTTSTTASGSDQTTSVSTQTTNVSVETTSVSVLPVEHNPCYDNFTRRPESERACVHGMCEYGRCVVELSFSCRCDKGADGIFCQYRCCLDCGPHGTCKNSSSLGAYCNCHTNYTGDRCETMKTSNLTIQFRPAETVTWYWWVVGVCAVVLVVLIVLLLVAPYIMWKHRVILVMKIVHYFQKYEDDDDREWDVFISYKSTERDESFVLHTLYPKLELEMGFKLNMHFRDFIPGDTIANNIIKAVQGSRRTLLVITPNYVKSEFTRFEYQVAQQEMLKRKHRIIPVLLEDISECELSMDPNLKTILSSVTYLEWPNESSNEKKVEKFWKRMLLSLPKKQSRSESNKSSPQGVVAVEEVKISGLSTTEKSSNGVIFSNKEFYDNDPEDDYDTLNECDITNEYSTINEKELDKYNESTNIIESKKVPRTEGENVADQISTC